MTLLAWVALGVGGLLMLTAVIVTIVLWPQIRATAEQQRIDDHVRQAQWQLRQATTAALQQLLAEGRRRS